ncbi:nucleoid occlusion protein [Lysinibacillus sp. fkY74-1]|uniref:Nucleoid occlusion protein n=3 Tax=Lysinibacillus TaxID=400634 RepID=NOC_LYSSC|nr:MULTISPECIES: nucleoid occlusion protein [Lysinibacillus]B1HPM0.1 RecName: Full=Nucleoid occlusion protein; Short=Noc [Lysinibacillus sphaericus C3-41]MBE5085971.1 nucleoid occlusion protein [Bacillus thuringiensis]ACA42222.1 Protein yyaA [Lysinibacillus sphaericus C3-41]AMO31531.1 nucleoid occlusion protein [Lysinibacillus sphaericus]AMR89355.1 nucleoid occlusion protein [Lysinibacillus sphaericus]ANA47426.1 nucleoid occlusion protein [Lysinibacillus sphaericus]
MKSPFSRFFGGGSKTEPIVKNEVEQAEAVHTAEEVIKLPIDQIVPNRFQPRTIFDDEKIEELSRTIHTHGVIQPIVVRKTSENQYEIIAGERRYRAMKKLQWTEVPAIVRNLTDKETASIALIENLQREELTAIEEAVAYQKLLELHELTQEALAQRLGKGQSTVANKLRLLRLPDEVQQAILQRKISERHARALIAIKDQPLQLEVLQQTVDNDWNVRQLEEQIQAILHPVTDEQESVPKKAKPKRKAISKDVRIALNTIKQSLTMVTKSGITVKTEEEDTEEYYQITVKIPKKKKV